METEKIMAMNKRKRLLSERTARIILCAALYAALALFIGGLFLLSSNYQKIYKSPTVTDGKVDFSGIELESRDVACNLAGKWEFYYNEWIVTDSFEGEPDGMIGVPGLWTYRNFGKGTLPKTGYASYRLVAENVQAGVSINVFRHNSDLAYRVFLNGTLNVRSGTLSKDLSGTKVSGTYDERIPYVTDGGTIEIVIELSATNGGGLNAAPWLNYVWSGNTYGSRLRSYTFIALGITTAAVAVSILSYAFFRYKRDITVPAFMAGLFVHFIASKDMMYVFPVPFTLSAVVRVFSALVAFSLLILHLRRCGARIGKPFLIASSVAAAGLTACLLGFYGTPLAPAFAFLLLALGCAYLIPLVYNEKFGAVQRVVYGALFTFLISVFCFELCDGLGLFVFGTEFIFSIELMLIIACFAALWLGKLARSARNAIRVSELECELSSVKHQALQAQIKPHFVYNSLTAIQARYRDGLGEGDRAIEQFAGYLRLITDSNGEDMIPFDDEVRNVLNYFELENLRANGKLNLLLDLNFTEFSVPVLSLQPFVENAIRHGGLREKADGWIRLSSEKTETGIEIEISDNGRGFDVSSAHAGVGIENTRKRFELLNAAVQVSSEPGRGTRVLVKIPLESI